VLSAGETSTDKLVVSTDDITSAFCQSYNYEDGIDRFLKLHSPLVRRWRASGVAMISTNHCTARARHQSGGRPLLPIGSRPRYQMEDLGLSEA
jgi:hypothetical protein